MIKLSLILLQAAIAVLAVNFGDNIINIASFKSDIGVQQRHFNEIYYEISRGSATWSGANEICRRMLGASLVTIQSEAEWESLGKILENHGYGFGTTYWTAIEEPLPPFLPTFPIDPSPLSRAILYFTNRYDMHIRFLPSTQMHRYICEFRGT